MDTSKFCFFVISVIFCQELLVSACSLGKDKNIVDGFFTEKGQFPYTVSIFIKSINRHNCGGSVFDEWHIITAAHCVYNWLPDSLLVLAGSNDLSDPTITKREIESMKVHESYNQETTNNDIAIIKLAEKLELSEYIKPISLTTSEIKPGTNCTVVGWGDWSAAKLGNDSQKAAYTPFVDIQECAEANENSGKNFKVNPETMVCTGAKEGGNNVCMGDSGGPLICENQLTGVTSWGKPCALPNYPSVFAKVKKYISWIKDNTSTLD